ncbi:unnamed protein product [Microthlaspi erraticum]|uniref:Uncharacterized protein n=3 Tax=Microthlaspi erraticum TaxID=1685480 RepID=A0A6D2IUB4_9BRAS|nr:unnamed protein product [Microthlaspi erraticum]
MEALAHYKMAFPQMHPSFVRHVIGCAVRAREEGVSFGVRDLRKLFSVKNNTRLPGSFYSSPRPNRRIFTNTPQRDSGWSDEMFFFRVSEATMGDFDFGRIRTEWATSVVVDPVPNNPGIDYLVERLGREKVNWSTFTPERIRRVLSSPPAPPPDRRKILAPLLLFLLSTRRSKMPRRQPLRSRTAKGAKGASSGGSRVRAGEFVTAVEEAMASKPTAGSSALADQVVDQVDATAEGEIVPLPSTVHVSSDRTRSSDQGHSRQASKRARSDDGEARSREGGPTASNGSGGKPPFYWQYENSRGFPVQDDEEGTARIQLHFKPVGCRLPSLNQMSEKELYIATCAASGRAVAARNMLVSRLESRIRDAPQQKELDQVKELVAKLTSDLSAANERVARQGELLKKHTSQEGRVKELETREADLLRQLSQNQEQMAALQKESSSALTQSLRLSRENQAKFEEKRVEGEKEGDQIELQSNIDLLTSLISGAINQEEELARLKGLEDEVAEAAKAAQVSDFSIGKFNLPVVSEDSVARMEIDPSTSIPVGLNPFGTNAEEKGSNEEEEKEDEEMTVVSISDFSKNSFNLFFLRLFLRLSCLRRIVKQEKGKAVDLGGDGKFTPHAETTLDAESLDTFRQDFGIPDEIELVLPAEGEDPEHVRPGFCCAYTSYWRSAGMIFPVPRFLMEALAHYKMAFPQMHPSFVRHVIGCAVRAREEGVSFGVRDLRKLFSVKNNTRLSGSFYSSPRPNRRIFTNTPQRDSGWSDECSSSGSARPRWATSTLVESERWATSVVVDPVPNNPGIDYLVERLGREKVNWNTFTPERIRRVLSSPPAPPPADLPVRSAQDSSSASSVPPLSRRPKMPRRQPLRSRTAKGAKALPRVEVESTRPLKENRSSPEYGSCELRSDSEFGSRSLEAAPKRARSDDGETRSREGGPTASNGSGGKPPFYWQYENSRGFPVQDDEEGTARIQLHFKPVGCRLPSLNQMSEKELYIATCAASGRAVAARNMLVSRLESRIRDAPQQKELDQVKELVAKLTSDLSAANERVARQGELLKKHTSQEGRVKELETREADLLRQLSQNQEQMAALQKESSSALTQSLRLSRENQVLVAEKDNIARRANRAGRREMVAKHREVLESAKAKFEEKRVEGEKEGDQIELQSNIDLLTSLISGAINQEEELARLKGLEDEVAEAAKAAQVSDFSIGKFNLPVVSEDSVARMEIDPSTSIPVGLNPFGTNAEEKGSNEEEEKEDEEMTVED